MKIVKTVFLSLFVLLTLACAFIQYLAMQERNLHGPAFYMFYALWFSGAFVGIDWIYRIWRK